MQKLLYYYNPNFIIVNLPTHIRFRWNCKLFLTLTHSSYSKWKDILHTLKVYKISAKEHQGVNCSAAYEISVLEILRICPINNT